MKITRSDLAKWVGISSPFLSQILNGHYEISRATAKKLSKRLSKPWNNIIVWKGDKLEEALRKAYRNHLKKKEAKKNE